MVNINYINSLLDTCLVPTQRKNVTIYRLFVRSNKESLHTHNTVHKKRIYPKFRPVNIMCDNKHWQNLQWTVHSCTPRFVAD